MNKYRYVNIVICILIAVFYLGCDDAKSPRVRNRQVKASVLPSKGAKVALLFMPGAGAYEASAYVLAKMEEDLSKKIGDISDIVFGASSGALLGSAVLSGKKAQTIADDAPNLVKNVFGNIIEVMDLSKAADLTDKEINKLAGKVVSGKIEFTSDDPDKLAETFKEAPRSSLPKLIKKKTEFSTLITKIMAGKTSGSTNLKNTIDTYLGAGGQTVENFNSKLLVLASDRSNNYAPVLFGHDDFVKKTGLGYADKTTLLNDALLATACIPSIFDSPVNVKITDDKGTSKTVNDLVDGSFSLPSGSFDPSEMAFNIIPKIFDKEDIIIVLVGNGGPIDIKFRKGHPMNWAQKSFQVIADNRTITYIALDLKIMNDKTNMFYLAGFAGSTDTSRWMKEAADVTIGKDAYKFTIDAIKAAKGL